MAAMFSRHFKSAAFTCRAQDPGNGQSRTTRTLAGKVNQSEAAIQWLLCYSFKTNYKFRLTFQVAFRARKLR